MKIPYLLSLFVLCLLSISCSPGSGPGGKDRQPWELKGGRLALDGITAIEHIPAGMTLAERKSGEKGIFIALKTDSSGLGIQSWPGIKITDAVRLASYYRMKPWWTSPLFVESESDLPGETHALFWQRRDRKYGFLLPLIDRGYRVSARGEKEGLSLIADNNCSSGERGATLVGAYLSVDDDPYALVERGFQEAMARMGKGSLRKDKPLPPWLDYLGWASWYAFFQDVNEEKFLSGVSSLFRNGVRLGYVLLDDGWEGVNEKKELLTTFEPDPEKFPHSLEWLVEKVTVDYHVPYFLVWQTMEGYWKGIDSLSPAMAGYKTYRTDGRLNRPINMPRYEELIHSRFNTPCPEALQDFYDDYHAFLATSGVDGVKVDNQSALEYMTYNLGPIAEVTGSYIWALENSVEHYFGPSSIINCMSMVPEAFFQYRKSAITRTSTDFFPDSAESWGPHLAINAYNSFIWGQVIQPDWDMTKSVHPWAAYHAAARALSGGPVYLSDEPGKHDPELIRCLALADGRILRSPGPPLPTEDILLRDPQTENVLLKIFNRNRAGLFVLAAFNCRYRKGGETAIVDTLSVRSVRGTSRDSLYAVFGYGDSVPHVRRWEESWPVRLSQGEFRIYTVAAIDKGIAPLGHLGMYNGGGIFEACGWKKNNMYAAKLLSGGEIGFYCERTPLRVEAEKSEVKFDYNPERKLLVARLDQIEPFELRIFF